MKITHILPVSTFVALSALTLPALADTQVFTVTLSGANEVPANNSQGLGVAIITFDTTAFTMHVEAIFAGLTGTTTAAHIHCCTVAPGAGTAGVATQTPSFSGFPLGVHYGSMDVTYDMTLASSYNASYITNNGGTTASAFNALLAGATAGGAYLNFHSTFAPGGEIRGFLVTAVPEPATYALMFGGLGLVGFVARRRRQV
jgi:hypothetical protein